MNEEKQFTSTCTSGNQGLEIDMRTNKTPFFVIGNSKGFLRRGGDMLTELPETAYEYDLDKPQEGLKLFIGGKAIHVDTFEITNYGIEFTLDGVNMCLKTRCDYEDYGEVNRDRTDPAPCVGNLE